MRVRLDEEMWARLLALPGPPWKGEWVEVTPTTGGTVKIKTCAACGATGEIGVKFYVSNPTYCKPCTTTRINDHIRAVNDATRDKAENHRQPWSELEVETLLAANAEGMAAKDIAELLGRTYLAVHGKLEALRKLAASGEAVRYITVEHTTTKITWRDNTCPVCHLVKPCFCD